MHDDTTTAATSLLDARSEARRIEHVLDQLGEDRVLLHDLSWEQHEAITDALHEQRRLRTTYDRGSLEVVTLAPEHEGDNSILALFVHVLCEECGVPVKNLGSTTCRREDLDRGLEPDHCFYTKNWIAIHGIADYREIGVSPIWIVSPTRLTVRVYPLHKHSYLLREHDALAAEDILPGFRCPVRELFLPADLMPPPPPETSDA
jgi:Uma2 family endonuclease